MSDYSKVNEKLIEIGMPLFVAIILYCLEVYSEKYYLNIVLIGLGIILTGALVYSAFWFLDKREERWKENQKEHDLFKKNFIKIKSDMHKVVTKLGYQERDLSIYQKLNKLENQIIFRRG